MSSFAKLVAVLFSSLLATAVAVEKPGDETPSKSGKKEASSKKSSKEKKDKSNDEDSEPKSIQVPMPNGRDAKGLKIPYFDEEGKLQMRFDIGVAKRIDDNHVEMSQLQVETFDEAGEREMVMDLPTSVLDLTTSVITAQHPVTIKRSDFEITGSTMIFNTKTKQGGLGGKVRMLIYNLENETSPAPEPSQPQAK